MASVPSRRYSESMQVDTIVRIIFTGLFAVTVLAGLYLLKNFEKLLGADPRVRTDNSGARTLNKVQVITIWVHILAITAAFAFFG